MAGVFVSYAREDVAKAKVIARELESASFDVWFDERIHSGSEFSREIEQALADAAAVVVLWSNHSANSAWVRDEAAEGRDSGRLISVLLDDSRPPIGFRQFQATDMSRWSGRGRPKQIDELIASIRAKAGTTTSAAVKPAAPVKRTGAILWFVAAIVVVGVGLATYISMGRAHEPSNSAPSVALLPFTADSLDPQMRSLAAATHDALAQTLSQGAFAVSVLDSVPKANAAPPDYTISGEVSGAGDKVTASIRMDETAHHYVVFSHQFEAALKDAAGLPERVGAQVAAQVSWTAPALIVERRYPSDPAVAAALLQTTTTGLGGVDVLHDYEISRRLAAKAPNSPLAQGSLAINTAFALGQLPREERAEAVAAGRRAADRAIELAPENEIGYNGWSLLRDNIEIAEAEDKLRTAMRADPDDSWANWFLSSILNDVGRARESSDLAQVSLAHDPYMLFKIARAIAMLEATGRTDQAEKLYQQSTRWWPGSSAIVGYRLGGIVQRGDFKALEQFNAKTGDLTKSAPVFAAVAGGSLPQVRAACSAAQNFALPPCMIELARLGDLDAAYGVADRIYPSRTGRSSADAERIWLDNPDTESMAYLTWPVGAPMRRDPRFLAVAERVGLLEYWRSGRLPDFCAGPTPEPVCAQIRRR